MSWNKGALKKRMLQAPENTTPEKSGNLSRQLCWPQFMGCTHPRGEIAQPLWDCPALRWWAQEVPIDPIPLVGAMCLGGSRL